ncbi:sulfatase-like hydrolase/transferase [Massilia sp. ST3]|uniref:sulfatase-like hydrolase/transferase n=1 Tax=Massilia sp. ST3 TaxID=2824903 RepID=UPI001B8413FD|nr:sulfatase-like hydrolase/transferase [Massilia sp. ST3]MBQ5948979.1 sulfatase-like hydrolase/transferase [Massilia sp. ST3]
MSSNSTPGAVHGPSTSDALPVIVSYVLAASSVLAVKHKIMAVSGYRIVARILGLEEAALGPLLRMQFFALDILVFAAVLPCAFLILARVAGRTAAARTSMLLSLMLVLLAFANLQALGSTGKMLSIDQLAPMLAWVRERPGAFFDYVSPGALARLAVLFLLAAAAYWLRDLPFLAVGRRLARPAAALCVLLSFAAAGGMAARTLPASNFHASAGVDMLSSLVSPGSTGVGEPALAQALQALHYRCDDPAPQAARRRNFVFYVMETIPYELYASQQAGSLPAFRALEKSAYVATQHYSTYPFTSYARFSLFTGLYPSFRLEKTLPLQAHYAYRSALGLLAEQGYDFKVFDPVTVRYPVDDWVVHQLGGEVVSAGQASSVAAQDERVITKAVDQIARSAQAGTPFVVAVLPQVSHGPWLPAGAPKGELYREGAARLRELDQGLARIVAALKQAGVYEDTVLVVTADHGLRTRNEAQFLSTEVLNSASYHVPMIIHDPALQTTHAVSHPTTHLDLSPTLHCLYGQRQQAIDTQGVSMLSARAVSRTVHFDGAWYHGSEGLWDGERFYSYNRQLGLLWSSTRFDFSDATPVADEAVRRRFAERLQQREALQHALLERRPPVRAATVSAGPMPAPPVQ